MQMTSELAVPAPAVLPASGSTTTSAPAAAPGGVDDDDDDNDDDDFQSPVDFETASSKANRLLGDENKIPKLHYKEKSMSFLRRSQSTPSSTARLPAKASRWRREACFAFASTSSRSDGRLSIDGHRLQLIHVLDHLDAGAV